MKVCSIADCNNKNMARTLCSKHYYRLRANGNAHITLRGENTCKVVGCRDEYSCKGYCQRHYWRLRRHGSPSKTKLEMHGMTHTKEYKCWKAIIGRCYNRNSKSYKHYGGRGITVCERWRNSFTAFYEDMGLRPKGLSIDRINNDGNYEPSNCRWTTMHIQIVNRRLNKKNTTGTPGLQRSPNGKKWVAHINSNYKQVHLGTFDTKAEAKSARKKAEKMYF